MQAKEEKWDLYDQQGRKTGKTIQAGETVPYGYCLYCVGIWVIDSEKKDFAHKNESSQKTFMHLVKWGEHRRSYDFRRDKQACHCA